MNEQPLYLKPNVVIEPLFNRWYAWSHLISPATAAMNITGRHLKILNSYIQAPHIHAAAVKNPKMLGGPFVDYDGGRVDDIRQLRDRTIEEQNDLVELSEAIKQLEKLLKNHPKGFSLEPLYDKIPAMLKGYVELVYDLNNNPSYRFFEHLLYKSPFYKPSCQSIALWITENDERPFVLSTPRLDEKHVLHLNIPFNHPGIDELAKMKRTPQTYAYIKDMMGIKEEEDALFRTFFTAESLPGYKKYEGDKIRMRYFGHACILVETKEVSILVDPLISYYGYQHEVARFSDIDLPDVIDYVLITHNHQDHVLFETLLPLRHKIRHLIVPRSGSGALQDPSLKLMFKNMGFQNIFELDEMESTQFSDCTITGIPFLGEHCDLNIHSKICHHVKVDKFSMLFVADSCNIEPALYQHIYKEIGDVDIIFIGMECDGAPLTWLYGPLMTDELSRDKDSSRRLAGSNFERGMALVDVYHPKEVYVYAMGMEPWLKFISSIQYTDESNPIIASNMLVKKCIQQGIVAERLYGEKELFYLKQPVHEVLAEI
ncbi:MBL fold metallo-hydrolase [Flavitalea sp. BT771]|uniref:MBL fold metallo-hydrolase n=1 Tax=Flavitalea sp. BT771 TaxID=3063329 RepID=UPI0026E21F2B|nr:MBL fold metallo-hydrolase [Flavitalea sp. BT771]MDO6435728.1 MBL fold metallo-hydrolase [Flavitalea sp. BT771]MDV6224619.1 MBL fold metallo-hydrolase [Flavitalea sp. BT771]